MGFLKFKSMDGLLAQNISLGKLQVFIWSVVTILTFSSYLITANLVWSIIFTIVNTISTVLIVYGNAFFLIPRLYKKDKLIIYILSVLALLFIVSLTRFHIRALLIPLLSSGQDMSTPVQVYVTIFISSIITFFFSLVFHLAMEYFVIQKEQQALKEYTAQVELNLLKSQVQPHFLFNTLNNIYYLAHRESPKAAQSIEKLSNIMRYFSEEAFKPKIDLLTDIQFIQDYIDLERMRMRYPMKLDFKIWGNTTTVQVPPMLVIPLVENVFKHGIDKRSKGNGLLLHFFLTPQRLRAIVKNPKHALQSPTKENGGLNNLASRLKLLYGDSYQLIKDEQDGLFTIELNIPI